MGLGGGSIAGSALNAWSGNVDSSRSFCLNRRVFFQVLENGEKTRARPVPGIRFVWRSYVVLEKASWPSSMEKIFSHINDRDHVVLGIAS